MRFYIFDVAGTQKPSKTILSTINKTTIDGGIFKSLTIQYFVCSLKQGIYLINETTHL